MNDNGEKSAMRQMLVDIKEDLKTSDNKLEQHLIDSSEGKAHLQHLCTQVQNLNKIITQGNGQESVLVRLSRVRSDISEIKEDVRTLSQDIKKFTTSVDHATRADVSRARWRAGGKFAGLLLLIIPGVLAFFGFN